MTAYLLVNDVIRSLDQDPATFRRVLALDPVNDRVAVIVVPDGKARPMWEVLSTLVEDVEEGRAKVDAVHSFGPVARTDTELGTAACVARERRWALIEPLVREPTAALADLRALGGDIAKRARDTKTPRATFYRLLRVFWQGGQNQAALVPAFDRRGAPGKPRIGGRKPGPKRAHAAAAVHRLALDICADLTDLQPYLGDSVVDVGPEEDGADNGEAVPDTAVSEGIAATASVRKRLQEGGLRYHLRHGESLRTAYHLTLIFFFNDGEQIVDGVKVYRLPPASQLPSWRQFEYHYGAARSVKTELEVHGGKRRFALLHRPRPDSAADRAFGPGAEYQVDATVCDLYLLSGRVPLRVIGRPVLYIVRDAATRMYVGWHVGLEGPNWTGMMMALESAFLSKVEPCRALGIDVSDELYPSIGLPGRVLGDRGELISANADPLVDKLHVPVLNAGSYRADWKPFAENGFKVINDLTIDWMPGRVYNARDRGDPDFRLDATLTLHDFTRIVVNTILHCNLRLPVTGHLPLGFATPDGSDPRPIDLWRWGRDRRIGQLRTASQERVRSFLLPSARARINGDGVHINGMRYWPEREDALPRDWLLRNTARGSHYEDAGYDPRDVTSAVLRLDTGRRLERVVLTGADARRFHGATLAEVLDARAVRRRGQQLDATRQLTDVMLHRQTSQAIIDAAVANREALEHKTGGSVVVRDIRGARQVDLANERQRGAWTGGRAPESTAGETFEPTTLPEAAAADAAPSLPIPIVGPLPDDHARVASAWDRARPGRRSR